MHNRQRRFSPRCASATRARKGRDSAVRADRCTRALNNRPPLPIAQASERHHPRQPFLSAVTVSPSFLFFSRPSPYPHPQNLTRARSFASFQTAVHDHRASPPCPPPPRPFRSPREIPRSRSRRTGSLLPLSGGDGAGGRKRPNPLSLSTFGPRSSIFPSSTAGPMGILLGKPVSLRTCVVLISGARVLPG